MLVDIYETGFFKSDVPGRLEGLARVSLVYNDKKVERAKILSYVAQI